MVNSSSGTKTGFMSIEQSTDITGFFYFKKPRMNLTRIIQNNIFIIPLSHTTKQENPLCLSVSTLFKGRIHFLLFLHPLNEGVAALSGGGIFVLEFVNRSG